MFASVEANFASLSNVSDRKQFHHAQKMEPSALWRIAQTQHPTASVSAKCCVLTSSRIMPGTIRCKDTERRTPGPRAANLLQKQNSSGPLPAGPLISDSELAARFAAFQPDLQESLGLSRVWTNLNHQC
jgi:hypothetical protein